MRHVDCSHCGRAAGHGTSQVLRKLLFHFCAGCWRRDRAGCEAFMLKVTA